MQLVVQAVFSCVASRNKRGRAARERWQSQPKAGRTPGRYSNSRHEAAYCGPPEGRRPARTTLRVARAQPSFTVKSVYRIRAARSGGGPNGPARKPGNPKGSQEHCLITESSPPAVSATSSDELQSAAWGGGGLRGSKSRRSNIPFTAPFCEVRPRARPPAPAYGVRCAPRTAIPLGIALLALSSSGRRLRGLG